MKIVTVITLKEIKKKCETPFQNSSGSLDMVQVGDEVYLRMLGTDKARFYGPMTPKQTVAFNDLSNLVEAPIRMENHYL